MVLADLLNLAKKKKKKKTWQKTETQIQGNQDQCFKSDITPKQSPI